MVVNEEAKTISMNILSTGYDESTIHAIVNEEGSNADKTLFTTTAATKDFYDALNSLEHRTETILHWMIRMAL